MWGSPGTMEAARSVPASTAAAANEQRPAALGGLGRKRPRRRACNGATALRGIVATVGDHLPRDLARGGGELAWEAGPIERGPGLGHGTAGNGYAFLKLFALTGDELWRERARRFAMHAIAQVDRERAALGRGRYTLLGPATSASRSTCSRASTTTPAFRLSTSGERMSREVKLSSADRVLFPDDGITKGDLFEYYGRVARRSCRTCSTARSR